MLVGDLDYVDDGNSWQKLKKAVEASTNDEDERLTELTQRVVGGLLSKFAKESIEENLKLKKKKRAYDQGEKEACLIRKKQKMIIREKGVKRCVGTSGEEEKDEDYLLNKQKKQRGNDKKNHKQKNSGEVTALLALERRRPTDMPEAFKNCIENLGGTQIKLVFHKIIYATDLSKSHNRFSMSKNQVSSNFLSEEEERAVAPENGGMDVILVEPRLVVSRVRLAKWHIGENEAYVFKTQWYQVVCDNPLTLKPKAVVQIWSFRIVSPDRSQLGFAMIPVGGAQDSQQINKARS